MARERLEAILAEAADRKGDLGARRVLLDRLSTSLLSHPAMGGQLVARLCATDADSPELERLTDLIGCALDTARMARENNLKRGEDLLTAISDAVALAAGQKPWTPRAWIEPFAMISSSSARPSR